MDKRIACGLCSLSLLFVMFMRWKNRRPKREKLTPADTVSAELAHSVWNTAIFFPDYFPEKPGTKTRQLIWYLDQAEETISVCVYGFCFPMLRDALMKKAREGVIIRVLTNKFCADSRKLRCAGVRTRFKHHIRFNPQAPKMPLDLLHNKFVVIDDFAVITGSLNWTWSSITENFENVVITTHPNIVTLYALEFDRLWVESRSKETRKQEDSQPPTQPC